MRTRWLSLSVAIVLGTAVLYVGGTAGCGGAGYPLDDGWIHQTYARNLAGTGQFAYVPGVVSAGSTSPLWTLLLAVGHVLRLPPALWAYVLGGAGLLATSWSAAALTQRLYPRRPAAALWVGLACLVEWHLAWAAFSGMETTLFTFLSLLLIERYAARAHPFAVGAIGGLLVLARPEGVVLVLLTVLVIAIDRRGQDKGAWARRRIAILADLAAGWAALVIPYVVFNTIVSGQPLPNTFYAKQAEYRALLAQPLWWRLWRVVRRPLIGGQVLLLPGFVWQVVSCLGALREGRGASQEVSPILRLLPAVWWGAYLAVYALRLPVDYQYGRYVMPTIPYLILYGVIGSGQWLRPRSSQLVVRLFSRALPIAVGCTFLAFTLIGRQAYVNDVCVINGEMVDVAHWIRTNTPADALIAAHDIGALGYYGERALLDLAGLVTPEVIPFIGDEARLAQYLIDRQADYLVTFPSWYPTLTADERFVMVYRTDCALTRERGGDNMAVYRIQPGAPHKLANNMPYGILKMCTSILVSGESLASCG
jgi:hypothetical protein